MRYAQILPFDVCNGKGIGQALFVQGCHFHCKGCFNSEAFDFNCGKQWTENIENKFLKLINRPYIKRISILGGEPLADENVKDVCSLIHKIRFTFPDKMIWLFTGYTLEEILNPVVTDNLNIERDKTINCRKQILKMCDVLVDGRFEEEKKDLTLKFRGSSNQRIIDVQESLKQNKIILYCD